MKLDISSAVRFPDGEQAGVINQVVFDPETASVHEIVLETPDLVGRMILVPVAMLREDPGEVLTFGGDRDALDALPDYEVEEVPVAPEDWQPDENYAPGEDLLPPYPASSMQPVMEESNAPEGTVVWGAGAVIACSDGPYGRLDQVLIDQDGAVTHLVVRPDGDPADRRLAPIELVTEADTQLVQLSCSSAEMRDVTESFSDPQGEPEVDSLAPSS
jgi:hypothetical protein